MCFSFTAHQILRSINGDQVTENVGAATVGSGIPMAGFIYGMMVV